MNEPAKVLMTQREARDCVGKIKASMNDIRDLVLDLYERQGWEALGYDNWRECVAAEFESGQRYLYYQLEAAKIERNISTMVENKELPTSENNVCTMVQKEIPERQLRPLAKLTPSQQREAWQKVTEIAPEGKITAAIVQKVVKAMTTPVSVTPPPHIVTEAMLIVTFIISHLERIRRDDPWPPAIMSAAIRRKETPGTAKP